MHSVYTINGKYFDPGLLPVKTVSVNIRNDFEIVEDGSTPARLEPILKDNLINLSKGLRVTTLEVDRGRLIVKPKKVLLSIKTMIAVAAKEALTDDVQSSLVLAPKPLLDLKTAVKSYEKEIERRFADFLKQHESLLKEKIGRVLLPNRKVIEFNKLYKEDFYTRFDNQEACIDESGYNLLRRVNLPAYRKILHDGLVVVLSESPSLIKTFNPYSVTFSSNVDLDRQQEVTLGDFLYLAHFSLFKSCNLLQLTPGLKFSLL